MSDGGNKRLRNEVTLDKVLDNIGHFGRYQQRTYFLIVVSTLFSSLHNSQFVFCAAKVEYRCKVPECESKPPKFEPGDWGAFALPKSGSECHRRVPLGGKTCTPSNFHPNKTMKCNAWVYKSYNSIVAEFDIACAEWKRTMIGTFRNSGIFLALGITAYISDSFGRRAAFVLSTLSGGIMGVIRSFVNGYSIYIALEFIEAVIGAGLYSSGYILALEMVGINYRVICGNSLSSTFAIGQATCALIAWALPYWRTLTRTIYAPALILVSYCFIIDESIRWLLSKDRRQEAAVLINKAAVMNKKVLSPESVKMLTEESVVHTQQRHSVVPPEHTDLPLYKQVLKSKILMSRVCICSFWWITITFTYYGLSISSVSLAGNSYVNFILTSLVEIPGCYLSVITLDRFGRKHSIISAFFVCGISLLLFPLTHQRWMMIFLSMIGKLAISMIFASIYIYTIELFPTTARHSLMNTCSMIGRFGSMAAPQTPLLMMYWRSLPYVIFGAMAATSGCLMLFTPETLKTRLPDSIVQAENISSQPEPTTTNNNEVRNEEPTSS